MAVSRNDLCPCGSGKKHKKCCLGAPDPATSRRTKVLLYGSLGLAVLTLLIFAVAGRAVGSAVGFGSFLLVIGYVLAADSGGGGGAGGGGKGGHGLG